MVGPSSLLSSAPAEGRAGGERRSECDEGEGFSGDRYERIISSADISLYITHREDQSAKHINPKCKAIMQTCPKSKKKIQFSLVRHMHLQRQEIDSLGIILRILGHFHFCLAPEMKLTNDGKRSQI